MSQSPTQTPPTPEQNKQPEVKVEAQAAETEKKPESDKAKPQDGCCTTKA